MGKQQYMPVWASNVTMSYNKYMEHKGAFIIVHIKLLCVHSQLQIHPGVLKYHIYSAHSLICQQNVLFSKD